jgi:hypothetical protein
MDQFITSCEAAEQYPENLGLQQLQNETYSYTLQAYAQKLNERQSSLFCDESDAALDLLEYEDATQGESKKRHNR